MSTDSTVERCRRFTDKVFQKEWQGHVRQKNYALQLAHNEWVLSLDADERLSTALREEIEQHLSRDQHGVDGYIFPRHSYYLGRWIDCAACHQAQVFSGTPSECVNCHAEPEIHVGSFGLQCQYCRTVEAWTPANLPFHNFPLDHGDGGEVACATCHLDSYAAYTCYGCHEHQPESIQDEHRDEGIDLRKLEACTDCHPDGREE